MPCVSVHCAPWHLLYKALSLALRTQLPSGACVFPVSDREGAVQPTDSDGRDRVLPC